MMLKFIFRRSSFERIVNQSIQLQFYEHSIRVQLRMRQKVLETK